MYRLPQLEVGKGRWSLPLTGRTARLLAAALVQPAGPRRTSALIALLAEDPALSLFVVLRWGQLDPGSSSSLDSLERLAGWFSQHALRVLSWPADPTTEAVTSSKRKRWRRWVVRDVLSARVAAARAAEAGLPPGQVLLATLLRYALQWLGSAGTSIRQADIRDGQLPMNSRLRERIFVARGKSAGDPISEITSQAGRTVAAVPQDDWQALVDEVDLPRVERALRAWSPDGDEDAADDVFPLHWLCQRLARLSALESDFQRTLQAEKLAAMQQLAYGASHEINNPLANISTRAQTLLRDEQDPERRRKLATINAQAFRAHEMISDMMLFAKPPELEPKPVELPVLLEQVVAEMAPWAEQQQTRLTARSQSVPLLADPTHLAVAIRSLVQNALEALGGGGQVELWAVSGREEATVEIGVRDSGPGISDAARRHLFDPFYSGREAGRGLGLGLSKTWRIVQLHGGHIDVTTPSGEGTVFLIRLPAEPPTALPPQRCAS